MVAPQGLKDAKYEGSVDFVLDQQDKEFDVWQVRRRSTDRRHRMFQRDKDSGKEICGSR